MCFNMPVPDCGEIIDSNLMIKFVLGQVSWRKVVMFTHDAGIKNFADGNPENYQGTLALLPAADDAQHPGTGRW